MSPRTSRRSLVVGAAGAVGALVTGSYAWNQYDTRYYLRFRPLEAVNESDEPAALAVTVAGDLEEGDERIYDLEPAGHEDGRNDRSINGPWIKRSDEYSIRVRLDGEELVLRNREIVDRLDDSGWGSDCARVTLTVTPGRTLESRVGPSDVC